MNEGKNSEEHLVYIGIGSNINPRTNIIQALQILSQFAIIENVSNVWETSPVGSTDTPNFFNAVVLIRTHFNHLHLKEKILSLIENKLGRQRSSDKNAPRTIDLDILIFDNQIVDHEIWSRAHWAVPLAELIPNLINPISGEKLINISKNLSLSTTTRNIQDINLADFVIRNRS